MQQKGSMEPQMPVKNLYF